ncbi:MAG: putative addiction module antidote protein [Gammaproteobacteria bacterium]|nr:putative addiction module antidote protein [Gammaproteobacteria bacterium]
MNRSGSYQEYLIESLKDPKEAAGYLDAALEGGDISVFLLALQNVVQAQGGVTTLAKKTQKSRTSLYKALSKTGNPYLTSTNQILSAMDMRLTISPKKLIKQRKKSPKRAAASQ